MIYWDYRSRTPEVRLSKAQVGNLCGIAKRMTLARESPRGHDRRRRSHALSSPRAHLERTSPPSQASSRHVARRKKSGKQKSSTSCLSTHKNPRAPLPVKTKISFFFHSASAFFPFALSCIRIHNIFLPISRALASSDT